VSGLGDSVRVVYDVRGVPHIFGRSYDDVIRALGFVVARDRLFQMEMQTRVTAGTLSEMLGEGLLEVDREQRALGLAWSADREWREQDWESPQARSATAFAGGVNAWIDRVDRRTLPVEYRLLDAWPRRWEPVHSLYLARRMGYTLTYSTGEFRRARAAELIGREATDALFGRHSPIQEPIQPGPRKTYPWFDTTPLPPPAPPGRDAPGFQGVPAVRATRFPGPPDESVWVAGRSGATDEGHEGGIGSNNWAVAPARSGSGHALLAGDPHLDLSLPSIWYEAHLVVEGELDVYGVTIPGFPGIVIGFTRDIAWSLTNTGADVLDYYLETLDDNERPARYRVDGVWRELETSVQEYRDRRGAVLAVDTLYYTHRGPLRRDTFAPLSMRWTNLDEGTPATVFGQIARARSVSEFLEAAESWGPSAQNMIVADRAGHIAIRSTGRYPYRGQGDGADLLDGTVSAGDWTGYWPIERYPMGLRPAQGYLASANQEPMDSLDDATYLGTDWPSPWRAMRINRLLRDNAAVTVDDFRRFQTDPGNERAELFVPLFIDAAAALGGAHAGEGTDLERGAALLRAWDRRYTRDNTVAVLFELAMDELESRVWDELLPPMQPDMTHPPTRVATPGEAVLWRALNDSAGIWCDDRRTLMVEPCRMIVAQSLAAAYRSAVARFGEPGGERWRWDRNRYANIWHLLRQPALSALHLPVQGGPGNLNPSSGGGTHGSSWRMVVELRDDVRAWVTYPGGQSGNPMTRRYDDRIGQWGAGELEAALFPRTIDELAANQVMARLDLAGSR
jgi:penicillin amidase